MVLYYDKGCQVRIEHTDLPYLQRTWDAAKARGCVMLTPRP